MTDEVTEDFSDPIAALTCINAATERYNKSLGEVDAAIGERRAARKHLARMQQRFDNFVVSLKATAPMRTPWNPTYPTNMDEDD